MNDYIIYMFMLLHRQKHALEEKTRRRKENPHFQHAYLQC